MSNPAAQRAALSAFDNLLPKISLANLPTPVREYKVRLPAGRTSIFVKHDDLTGDLYGGNKVRKLEYLLQRARQKHCERIATFGAVGSNHALATALYARQLGYPCTCFLVHQNNTPAAARALALHLRNGTSLVRFGGAYRARLQTLRENLWGRRPLVVPAGGSSWLGTYGFVQAGLELARQVAEGQLPEPATLYVAAGTMGTAAGLALGFAAAGLDTEIQAIRVSHAGLCNDAGMRRLIGKTALMMRRLQPSIALDLEQRVNLRLRHEYFGGGYAVTNVATEAAIRFADDQLGLRLESTYTGKAMAALIDDLERGSASAAPVLFWNTCNSKGLPVTCAGPGDSKALPAEFLRYFSAD